MICDDEVEELIQREYAGVVNLPNLSYFITKYAKSVDANDIKAIQTFALYEGLEKKRSLQNELFLIKNGGAALYAVERICGLKRRGQNSNFSEWAQKMLVQLASIP